MAAKAKGDVIKRFKGCPVQPGSVLLGDWLPAAHGTARGGGRDPQKTGRGNAGLPELPDRPI